MQGVPTVFSVTFNWNPSYSYAKIPAGLASVPDYYKVLAQEVPHAQGLPHLKNVQIANLKAAGSRDAFSVSAYSDAPLEDVTFRDIDIQAQRAGTIQNARKLEVHRHPHPNHGWKPRHAKGIPWRDRLAVAVSYSGTAATRRAAGCSIRIGLRSALPRP